MTRTLYSNSLPNPPDYFPVNDDKFSFRIGLTKPGYLSDNFSAGKIFLIDKEFYTYRSNKLSVRKECFNKYVITDLMDIHTESIVTEYIIRQLLSDQSAYFTLKTRNNDHWLVCALTSEELHFDQYFKFFNSTSASTPHPGYQNAFDALACQIQDDLVLVQMSENEQNAITALHLCAPNHWSAKEKYGKDFVSTHENIPDFDHISQQSGKMLRSLIHKGPYVRFAWGLSSDMNLNHHPSLVTDDEQSISSGRYFRLDTRPLYMRIERQVILGIPEINGFLFTIRTYFRDIQAITNKSQLQRLVKLIESMSDETGIYKGIYDQKNEILKWLNSRLEL